MITRRIVGLIILAVIIVVGITLYIVLKNKVSDVESDLVIRNKGEIKGK
jgi:hypothetical protein